jgi:hypothetical protein
MGLLFLLWWLSGCQDIMIGFDSLTVRRFLSTVVCFFVIWCVTTTVLVNIRPIQFLQTTCVFPLGFRVCVVGPVPVLQSTIRAPRPSSTKWCVCLFVCLFMDVVVLLFSCCWCWCRISMCVHDIHIESMCLVGNV